MECRSGLTWRMVSIKAVAGEIRVDDWREAFDNACRREFAARVCDLMKKPINIPGRLPV